VKTNDVEKLQVFWLMSSFIFNTNVMKFVLTIWGSELYLREYIFHKTEDAFHIWEKASA
jgi:hypothetical protein